mmetsp:Transcript_11534/g.37898  ORF Transcript_11534/g.37898 Transcript_11534/m.37898 type:complete len:412 (+) Transcript_11534:2413-3648(+)
MLGVVVGDEADEGVLELASFGEDGLFECVGGFDVDAGDVVGAAVLEHAEDVGLDLGEGSVGVAGLEAVLDGLEVDGVLDDVEVVGDFLDVDGLEEGPGVGRLFRAVDQRLRRGQFLPSLLAAGIDGPRQLPELLVGIPEFAETRDGVQERAASLVIVVASFSFLRRRGRRLERKKVHRSSAADRPRRGFPEAFVELPLDPLPLPLQSPSHVQIVHRRVHVALHERAAVVVLDRPVPPLLRQRHRAGEALLLKVPRRVVVGVGQEVPDPLDLRSLLEVIHHPSPKATDLFGRGDGAEGDFGEFLLDEGTIANASEDFVGAPEDREAHVPSVEDQADDVLPGHLRQLGSEDLLQSCELLQSLHVAVVANHLEANLALLLQLTRRRLPRGDAVSHGNDDNKTNNKNKADFRKEQ